MNLPTQCDSMESLPPTMGYLEACLGSIDFGSPYGERFFLDQGMGWTSASELLVGSTSSRRRHHHLRPAKSRHGDVPFNTKVPANNSLFLTVLYKAVKPVIFFSLQIPIDL